jgi:large subunit ribosomal protein L17
MLANMASSLITHKRITTTLAKAKALRSYVEPLITKSKDDTTHSRRVVFSYLQDKEATAELFKTVGAKVADRPGGYTRIIKLAPRLGDNADIAMIELVDFNELLVSEKKAKKTTRRRKSAGAKVETTKAETKAPAAVAAEAVTEVEEAPAVEAQAAETGESADSETKDEASASEEDKKD